MAKQSFDFGKLEMFVSSRFYEEKLVKESIEYPKHPYMHQNKITKRRGNITALWGNNGTSPVLEDDYGKAQLFWNYFSNAYTIETPSLSSYTPPYILDTVTAKEHDSSDLINEINTDKSMGLG